MRPRERTLARELDAQLRRFDQEVRSLPGIQTSENREAFIEQLVESIRRIRYVSEISKRELSERRVAPASDLFDPLKAALLNKRHGQIDEAFWLVFLSVHFGKHRQDGWRLARDIYGRLGSAPWTWEGVSSDPKAFSRWLAENEKTFRADGISRRFGNHRKYESLKASSPRSTGRVIESYVQWVGPPRTHQMLIEEAQNQVGDDPRRMFEYLYRSMSAVTSFGRTGRFDYLSMVGKVGLAAIEPGSTYMQGATGPLQGARLLFGGSTTAALNARELDAWLIELEAEVDLGIHGMQVLEDALCNWQKSPAKFKPFRG